VLAGRASGSAALAGLAPRLEHLMQAARSEAGAPVQAPAQTAPGP